MASLLRTRVYSRSMVQTAKSLRLCYSTGQDYKSALPKNEGEFRSTWREPNFSGIRKERELFAAEQEARRAIANAQDNLKSILAEQEKLQYSKHFKDHHAKEIANFENVSNYVICGVLVLTLVVGALST